MPAYEFEAPPDVRLDDYERLETQGDSIIQLSLTLRIFQLYPRLSPGGATAIRAALDCNEHLAIMADQYGLPEKLRAIRGSLDRFRTLPTVRADLFKAYVASAFHDHGWQVTHDWLCQAFDADIRNAYAKLKRAADLRATAASNNVTAECVSLLELWKGRDPMNRIVSYEDIGVSGTAHAPTFEVVCKINGELKGTGIGTKKKKAKAMCVPAVRGCCPF